jgi:hypothetical protein
LSRLALGHFFLKSGNFHPIQGYNRDAPGELAVHRGDFAVHVHPYDKGFAELKRYEANTFPVKHC